ncbi:MAG: hypothetical protein LQ343_004860 [Gyalolechia ehrenbergii]|nr:MAG: hypothetical protein LQ343_004860 [Gyalolechia ehrenbergii]
MRASILSAILLNANLSLAQFSLSDLQPIAGFSDVCTQAYDSPLTDCTIADFYVGATCSPKCIAYLEAITKLLNDECRGITAFPDTLIGMFFQKTAIKKLCPNVGITTVTPTSPGQAPSPERTAGSTENVASLNTPATPSQISIQVTLITSEIETTTTASSILSTSTVPSTSSATTSVVLVSSTAPSRSGVDVGSAASSSPLTGPASSSGAEQASPTAGSQRNSGGAQGDNDGDGGTVLDAASKADRGARAATWLLLISAGLTAAIWSA